MAILFSAPRRTSRWGRDTTLPTSTPVTAPDPFLNSLICTFGTFGTFGATASPRAVFTVTPAPSKTASQYVQTQVGMRSVFAFQTPIP